LGPASLSSGDGSAGIIEVLNDQNGAILRSYPVHAATFIALDPSSGLAYVSSTNPPYFVSVIKYK
jgi:hypothetical protein